MQGCLVQQMKRTNLNGTEIAKGIIDLMIKFGYMRKEFSHYSSADMEEYWVHKILIGGINRQREKRNNVIKQKQCLR